MWNKGIGAIIGILVLSACSPSDQHSDEISAEAFQLIVAKHCEAVVLRNQRFAFADSLKPNTSGQRLDSLSASDIESRMDSLKARTQRTAEEIKVMMKPVMVYNPELKRQFSLRLDSAVKAQGCQ